MNEKTEELWWVVRLQIEEPQRYPEPGGIFIEERTLWALTPEDAIARAAGASEGDRIVGATVTPTEAP